MRVVLASRCQRHLVRAPGSLDLDTVHHGGPGPALGRDEEDHRPRPPREVAVLAGGTLDLANRVVGPIERRGQLPMHVRGVVALDGQHLVPVATQKAVQFLPRDPGRHGRVGDLVAVEVQDREHRAVVDRVDELVRVPRRSQRSGLELTVAHDCGDDEVGVVHRRAVGVGEDVAQLATLVDGAGSLRRDVARDATREGELSEQPLHTDRVRAHVWVDLAVGPFEPRIRHGGRTAVPRPGQEDRVHVPPADQSVEVGPEQVQPRGRAPVPEQSRLDVLARERAAQQRIVEEVDLTDGDVVGGAPPRVEEGHLLLGQYVGGVGRVSHWPLLIVWNRCPASPPCPTDARSATGEGRAVTR